MGKTFSSLKQLNDRKVKKPESKVSPVAIPLSGKSIQDDKGEVLLERKEASLISYFVSKNIWQVFLICCFALGMFVWINLKFSKLSEEFIFQRRDVFTKLTNFENILQKNNLQIERKMLELNQIREDSQRNLDRLDVLEKRLSEKSAAIEDLNDAKSELLNEVNRLKEAVADLSKTKSGK